MKRLVSLVLICISVFALAVPAFAVEPYSVSPVRYGIYDDKFIFEGVVYSSDAYSALDEPSFMYLKGDQLLIFSRSDGAAPYVTFDANGVLCYYDSAYYNMLTYDVSVDGSLSFVKSSRLKRFDPGLSDFESFRANFIVSVHSISYGDSGGVFMNAEPVVYYDVEDSGSHVFDDQDYFVLIVVLLFAAVLLLAIFVFVR